jgi:hypothetical protein
VKRKRRASHQFLLFPNLTLVTEVLSQRSTLPEILWNFGRFKDARRLTLKENPHFYKFTHLPTSPEAYVGDFKTDPIDNFQHAKICVLTDKPGRLYLETDQNSRAFGNVWVPNDAIIFKGSRITFLSTLPLFSSPSRRLWKARGRKYSSSVNSRRAQFVVSRGTSAITGISAGRFAKQEHPTAHNNSIHNGFHSGWSISGLERTDSPRPDFPTRQYPHQGHVA